MGVGFSKEHLPRHHHARKGESPKFGIFDLCNQKRCLGFVFVSLFPVEGQGKGIKKNLRKARYEHITPCAVEQRSCGVELTSNCRWRSGSRCRCLMLQPVAQHRSCVSFWITSLGNLPHQRFDHVSHSLTVSSNLSALDYTLASSIFLQLLRFKPIFLAPAPCWQLIIVEIGFVLRIQQCNSSPPSLERQKSVSETQRFSRAKATSYIICVFSYRVQSSTD